MTICPYCQTQPVRPSTRGGRPPVTCGSEACRLAMRRVSNVKAHRAQEARRKAERHSSPPATDGRRGDPLDAIEAAYLAARAARLARERSTGQRTFTLGDGWQQRGPSPYSAGAEE